MFLQPVFQFSLSPMSQCSGTTVAPNRYNIINTNSHAIYATHHEKNKWTNATIIIWQSIPTSLDVLVPSRNVSYDAITITIVASFSPRLLLVPFLELLWQGYLSTFRFSFSQSFWVLSLLPSGHWLSTALPIRSAGHLCPLLQRSHSCKAIFTPRLSVLPITIILISFSESRKNANIIKAHLWVNTSVDTDLISLLSRLLQQPIHTVYIPLPSHQGHLVHAPHHDDDNGVDDR